MESGNQVLQRKKVLLYGAGYYGKKILDLLRFEYKAVAFVDSDKSKWGEMIKGVMVIAPNEMKNYVYDSIIITFPKGKNEIIQLLIEEYGISLDKILDYSSIENFDIRSAALRSVAREINEKNLQGNVAEVGVYKGEFARVINSVFPDRQLYLFDTFSGFHSDDATFDVENGLSEKKDTFEGKYCNSDIDFILNIMEYPAQCIIKKGMFPETAEGLEEQFVFVSLDVDLYKPMYSGLRYFYPRMVSGGYIFVHDYNNPMFSGVKKAVQDFIMKTQIKCVPLFDLYGSLIIIK